MVRKWLFWNKSFELADVELVKWLPSFRVADDASTSPVNVGSEKSLPPRRNTIQWQPDDSGKHLRAVFVKDDGATRISLLYNSEEE